VFSIINIENEVFNTVSNALRAVYGDNIVVSGEYNETPSAFPFVTLIEDDNYEVEETRTLARLPETASNLTYTANVYSNLKSGCKTQAKSIMDIVDEQMHNMGFQRNSRNQLPNIDRTIYRVTARYTQVIQIFQ